MLIVIIFADINANCNENKDSTKNTQNIDRSTREIITDAKDSIVDVITYPFLLILMYYAYWRLDKSAKPATEKVIMSKIDKLRKENIIRCRRINEIYNYKYVNYRTNNIKYHEVLNEIVITLPKSATMELVYIPSGSYNIKILLNKLDIYKILEVKISKGFYISKYEINMKIWESIMGKIQKRFYNDCELENFPVDSITWDNIVGKHGFIDKINSLKLGVFRLPTVAEWLYACRLENQELIYYLNSNFIFSELIKDCLNNERCKPCVLDNYAWWCGNSGDVMHQVGQKLPNYFGIFDTYGNVSEICLDSLNFDNYTQSNEIIITDPIGNPEIYKVCNILGGNIKSEIKEIFSTYPLRNDGYNFIGFRVIMLAE